ncbi:RNase adapter RapZ [Altererythrobacter sp. GH1-8]|uniref:RNase adapter RapZ n=1 Tax=Altererythrobacter sp. GH1-8 TaxID=3349333 RepID=UPI00374D1E26
MTGNSPSAANPVQDQSAAKQQLLLLTGLSGAGKSTALDVLEDLGWEVIDNFPVRMLEALLSGSDTQPGRLAIGFDSRTRGFVPAEIVALVGGLSQRPDLEVATLFIDCASHELERRYNETRRRHPMAQDRPLQEGIRAERELLQPLRNRADMLIETTSLNSNDLQNQMREMFGQPGKSPANLTISSFGFARGMAPLADLVFDMRFLDNPHWVPELKEQTGLDREVQAHIRADPAFQHAFDDIADLVKKLLPLYAAQGKGYVHVAFGCTGGRHRSVFCAEHLAESLRKAGFSPTVRHRNLGSRAVNTIEGEAQ